MSVFVLEDYLRKRVTGLKCNFTYKSTKKFEQTLFLRGALQSLSVKNAYCLPFYRDNARASQFAQCGGDGFSVKTELVSQIFVSHASDDAVLRLL